MSTTDRLQLQWSSTSEPCATLAFRFPATLLDKFARWPIDKTNPDAKRASELHDLAKPQRPFSMWSP